MAQGSMSDSLAAEVDWDQWQPGPGEGPGEEEEEEPGEGEPHCEEAGFNVSAHTCAPTLPSVPHTLPLTSQLSHSHPYSSHSLTSYNHTLTPHLSLPHTLPPHVSHPHSLTPSHSPSYLTPPLSHSLTPSPLTSHTPTLSFPHTLPPHVSHSLTPSPSRLTPPLSHSSLGLCTRCSGFYLLCYALILSKCSYYAQSLHPICSLYAHYAASCLSDCMCFQFQAAETAPRDKHCKKAVRSRLAESASPGSSFKR